MFVFALGPSGLFRFYIFAFKKRGPVDKFDCTLPKPQLESVRYTRYRSGAIRTLYVVLGSDTPKVPHIVRGSALTPLIYHV